MADALGMNELSKMYFNGLALPCLCQALRERGAVGGTRSQVGRFIHALPLGAGNKRETASISQRNNDGLIAFDNDSRISSVFSRKAFRDTTVAMLSVPNGASILRRRMAEA